MAPEAPALLVRDLTAGYGGLPALRGVSLEVRRGAVSNQWMPDSYFHNVSPSPGQFLGLHLLIPADRGMEGVRERPGHPGPDTLGWPAVGTAVTVRLPGGRKLIRQVDGGSGHSGRRSEDLHFGLGAVDTRAALPVTVKWRDAGGTMREATLSLSPGWHTVLLGRAAAAAAPLAADAAGEHARAKGDAR